MALAVPSSPLGFYTRAYLEGLGLYETLLSRAVLVENAQAVVEAVRAGQADAGVAYGSATATASGARLLFRVEHAPLPSATRGLWSCGAGARTRQVVCWISSGPDRRRTNSAVAASSRSGRTTPPESQRLRRGPRQSLAMSTSVDLTTTVASTPG